MPKKNSHKSSRKKIFSKKRISSVPFLLGIAFLLLTFIAIIWNTTYLYIKYISVGLNVELTGEIPAVGLSSKNAAEMAVKDINDQGGVLINDRRYKIDLIIKDNQANEEKTKEITRKFLGNDLLGIIGPNASKYAIAAASIAEKTKILMISPWSTNPKTTLNSEGTHKKYVFRAAFLDSFQGKALAQFAYDSLQAKRAAIFYDHASDVLKGQADYFKKTFEETGGVVEVFETYKSGDTDFTAQLRAIGNNNPDVIFLPGYYNDAALIIKQARSMRITVPFLGSDAWGGQEILESCGTHCNGNYLSAHYAADSTSSVTQKFVEDYKNMYGSVPDDVAALTYDSFGLLFKAMSDSGKIDKESVVNALSTLSGYKGVTGSISFKGGDTDPVKSAVILQIKNNKLIFVSEINP